MKQNAFKLMASLLLSIYSMAVIQAQNDTIITKTGDMMIGEIKSLSTGVLNFDADYADNVFNMTWNEIDQVYTHRSFLIILSNGQRLTGTFNSRSDNLPQVIIGLDEGDVLVDDLREITQLTPIEKSFIGRLDASLEIGYTFTKTNNNQQFSTRSNLGYTAEVWGVSGALDILRSSQDSVAPTRRTDATIGGRAFFYKSWFIGLSNNFLQNDEQKLKLRSTTNLSVGRLIVNTSRTSWGIGIGGAYNSESFTTDIPNESSFEGLFNTELNLFAFDDLSLLTGLSIYPSFSIAGRIRSDFKFDIKYDLPLDFYFKVGFTHNFDNMPTAGASNVDYVIQTTVGWEL